jgi:uncharacterized protein (TIGR04255 family)
MVSLPPRPADLPDYEHPPIDEVVLGIEFAPLADFTQAHMGVMWNEIRADYPRTEDQPALIDPAVLQSFPFQFSPFGQRPGVGFRTWFISQDDQYVLQIQNDRLLHNWRRRPGAEYPRFELLFDVFYEHFERFQRVVQELGLGPVVPKQIEVTYINWITDVQVSDFFVPADVPLTTAEEVSNRPSQQQWSALYRVKIPGGTEGTLTTTCSPAIRPIPNNEQGYQFLLTFKAPTMLVEGVEELMAVGRNVVVRTFTDLTTEQCHRQWGLIQQ